MTSPIIVCRRGQWPARGLVLAQRLFRLAHPYPYGAFSSSSAAAWMRRSPAAMMRPPVSGA
jgi:hypothetical protein